MQPLSRMRPGGVFLPRSRTDPMGDGGCAVGRGAGKPRPATGRAAGPYRPATILASTGARAGSDIRAFRRAGMLCSRAGTAP
jgi:hypothetical protein